MTLEEAQVERQRIDFEFAQRREVLDAERAKHAAALAVTKGKLAQLREEYLYARLAVMCTQKANAQ